MNEKRQEVVRVANDLYRQELDWVAFFRAVLGVDGIVRQMYPDPAALAEFEKSAEYHDIQRMLATLREKDGDGTGSKEPTRVITVRLPMSLHESLKTEAHNRHTSMNKLCISKLLQVLDGAFAAPPERTEDFGRESQPAYAHQ
jgi:predicted HicB family RNase H-like nuclease